MRVGEKYHNMTTVELIDELDKVKKDFFQMRFNHASGQLTNPMQLKTCKKNIAVIKTILRERELEIEKMPKKAKKA